MEEISNIPVHVHKMLAFTALNHLLNTVKSVIIIMDNSRGAFW
jgi:hypothetical protein